MKLSLIRIILLALFSLLFYYAVKVPNWLLWAFVCTYAIDNFVVEVSNRQK